MSDYVDLEPSFNNLDGTVTREGDEIFVRGIGKRILGIGIFAGSLVLAETDGNKICHPVIEIQGELISGGRVDLWSTDTNLMDAYRYVETYPIDLYLAEIAAADAKIAGITDKAYAEVMGVNLD